MKQCIASMFAPMIVGLMAVTPAVAQERWDVFVNQITERQGAYMCADMNEETGDFFCIELACAPGAPLAVEISYGGGAVAPVVEARFSVNGVALSTHAFEQTTPVGYASYRSQTAAQDDTLRYWLSAGRTAEIAFGDEVQALSLAGSSAALNSVLTHCPLG